MENNMIISSKMCEISVIGEPHLVMGADLSVVCKDGKYGLVHTSRLDEHEGSYVYEKELILPCDYDNLFFVDIEFMPHLIAVLQGKQGLFCFEGCTNGYYEEIIVEQRVPCIYDRIEIGHNTDTLFLHSGSKIFCFSLYSGKIFAECEHVKELCNDWLLCISGDNVELWRTQHYSRITTLETDDITYLGTYEQGFVFKLKVWDEKEDDLLQQLLFCEYFEKGFHFGPKAKSLTVHTKVERKERSVVGIEMSFGNWEDKLSIEAVNEITNDKHSFEEK